MGFQLRPADAVTGSEPVTSADMERTFIAVKPDGVQRGLCGEIIKRLEQRGFHLVAAKFLQVTGGEGTCGIIFLSFILQTEIKMKSHL